MARAGMQENTDGGTTIWRSGMNISGMWRAASVILIGFTLRILSRAARQGRVQMLPHQASEARF